MKKLSLLIGLFFVFTGFGQDQQDEHPFIDRRPGLMRLYTGITPPTENSATKFDRFNTDFFYNTWIGDVNNVSTKFYAIGHNINLMFDLPFSSSSRFGVAIGFGYSHFNIRNDGEFKFVNEPGLTNYSSQLTPYTGAKRWINRTVFNFVEVPVEIRIRSNKERGKIKFYPGFKVGFMVENYMKWRISNYEYKAFNFPDLNRLHYGPSLRLGIDNVFLFAYYDMTYLFTHENSSQLQLVSAGISIGWF